MRSPTALDASIFLMAHRLPCRRLDDDSKRPVAGGRADRVWRVCDIHQITHTPSRSRCTWCPPCAMRSVRDAVCAFR